jgi:hypothetical protein
VHQLHAVPRAGLRRAPASHRACACTRQLAISGLRRGSSWSTRPPSWASSCSPPCKAHVPLCLGAPQSRAPTASMATAGSNPAPPPPTSYAPPWTLWTLPPRPHNSTGAGQAACSPPRPANSPKERQRRPEIHAAAVLHRRSTSRHPERQKSNPRRAYTTPPPFPGQVRPSPRRNPAISAAVRAKDCRTALQRSRSVQGLRCKN